MFETIWGPITLISIIWVMYDVIAQNKGLTSFMKVVWILVALIFGILGAIVYYFLGKNNNNNKKDSTVDESRKLRTVKHFIDPKLNNTPVSCNNPGIKIISYKLIDDRNYEDDLNWSIEIVYENTSTSPMWVIGLCKTLDSDLWAKFENHYFLLKNGERNKSICKGFKMNLIKGIFIGAYNTVVPNISPELQHVRITQQSPLILKNRMPAYLPVDIHSIKYLENERGWKYIIFEITMHVGCSIKQPIIPSYSSDRIEIKMADAHRIKKVRDRYKDDDLTSYIENEINKLNEFEYVKTEEKQQIKFPLNDYNAEDIRDISLDYEEVKYY